MPTIEQRYEAAVAYVRRAIKVVEAGPPTFDQATTLIEWYAGKKKTEPVRAQLEAAERQWMFARSEFERARAAREAELLADRTKETLPGAPADWKRTNLYVDERETQAAASTYAQEAEVQAGEVWSWMRDTAGGAVGTVGKWLLIGGGVVVAWKVVDLLRNRERRDDRAPSGRMLNSRIAQAARNAGPTTVCPACHRYHYTDSDGRLVPHESPTGGICSGSRRPPLVIASSRDRRTRKRKTVSR